jgi:hypothetical protein
MKRFKKFLIEADTTALSQGPEAQNVPSAPYDPIEVPGPHWYQTPSPNPNNPPPNENAPPDPIDWEDIDDRFRDAEDDIRQLLRTLSGLSWEQIVKFLQKHFGVNIPNDADLFFWLKNRIEEQMQDWFERTYPNSTNEQFLTYQELLQQWFQRFQFDIFDEWRDPTQNPSPYPYPPGGHPPIDIGNEETWPMPWTTPGQRGTPYQSPDVPVEPYYPRGPNRYYPRPPSPYPYNPYPGTYQA